MDVIERLGLPFDLVADVPDERLRVVGELNEALCDWALEVLAAKGYRARDVQRGDTYFVFGGYDCFTNGSEFATAHLSLIYAVSTLA